MRVLGILLAIALLLAGCLLGGRLATFIDVHSFVVVIGSGHGVLFGIYGADALRIFSPAFASPNPELGIRIAESGSHLYLVAIWVATLMGWIKISAGYGGDWSVLGPAFAVSLLTIFYAYCAHFLVWYPIKMGLSEMLKGTTQ